jgi:uncharacterized protein (DUF1330 family)
VTTYVIVSLRLRDKAWMREYTSHVPAIVSSYGGRYIAQGMKVVGIEGVESPPDRIGILTFPSVAALRQCMDSPEYAPYKQLRTGPADTEIIAFDAI